jgi:hypothetical protein
MEIRLSFLSTHVAICLLRCICESTCLRVFAHRRFRWSVIGEEVCFLPHDDTTVIFSLPERICVLSAPLVYLWKISWLWDSQRARPSPPAHQCTLATTPPSHVHVLVCGRPALIPAAATSHSSSGSALPTPTPRYHHDPAAEQPTLLWTSFSIKAPAL